jgi:hypothetical protein
MMPRQTGSLLSSLRHAIVKVGEARGFLVKMNNGETVVITAAHCLPDLPPAHMGSHLEERTYPNLLGPLGEKPTLWVECLFVDPTADVAVLCRPDGQALFEQWDAYERFVDDRPSFRLAAITRRSTAWLLNRAGRWESSIMALAGPGKMLTLIGARIAPGMSGSPIVSSNGGVVGIASHEILTGKERDREQYEVALVNNLPIWLLADCVNALPKVITAHRRRVAITPARLGRNRPSRSQPLLKTKKARKSP